MGFLFVAKRSLVYLVVLSSRRVDGVGRASAAGGAFDLRRRFSRFFCGGWCGAVSGSGMRRVFWAVLEGPKTASF